MLQRRFCFVTTYFMRRSSQILLVVLLIAAVCVGVAVLAQRSSGSLTVPETLPALVDVTKDDGEDRFRAGFSWVSTRRRGNRGAYWYHLLGIGALTATTSGLIALSLIKKDNRIAKS